MALSARLSAALENSKTGLPLWDICCDHGQLGLQALQNGNFSEVHFVDQVPHIIQKLENLVRRKQTSETPESYFYTQPAENLSRSVSGSVCILGVGGQKIEKILREWDIRGQLQAERLILSPHKDVEWLKIEILPNIKNYKLQKQIDLSERGRLRSLFILDRISG